LYRCLKASITGDLKVTLFDQFDNIVPNEDGPELFKQLTGFTMVASIQLSMLSFKSILEFQPGEYEFQIPTINTKLNHLFVLASTRERNLSANERIQHVLTVYSRIKQPETWAQWVRNQVDDFQKGALAPNCQSFMNSAAVKYHQISGENDGAFPGSGSTLQEDIVAMVAAARKRVAPSPRPRAHAAEADDRKPFGSRTFPPFVKHYRHSPADDSPTYTVGDTKMWNNDTWHYCECPTHRDNHKWHIHATQDCRTRQKWLKTQEGAVAATATGPTSDSANIASQSTNANVNPEPRSVDGTQDINVLLANAFNLIGDNSIAKDLIADALSALADA
jgi:hypothetical protein